MSKSEKESLLCISLSCRKFSFPFSFSYLQWLNWWGAAFCCQSKCSGQALPRSRGAQCWWPLLLIMTESVNWGEPWPAFMSTRWESSLFLWLAHGASHLCQSWCKLTAGEAFSVRAISKPPCLGLDDPSQQTQVCKQLKGKMSIWNLSQLCTKHRECTDWLRKALLAFAELWVLVQNVKQD